MLLTSKQTNRTESINSLSDIMSVMDGLLPVDVSMVC